MFAPVLALSQANGASLVAAILLLGYLVYAIARAERF